MASLFSSVLQFHGTLTAANFPGGVRPPAYEWPVPQTTATSAQLRPPYVTYQLVGGEETQTFEDDDVETYTLTATAFAVSQADADAIVKALRWNGQSKGDAAGFDNRNTLTNFTEGSLLGVYPQRPPVPGYAGSVDKDGKPMHKAVMEWRVEVQQP